MRGFEYLIYSAFSSCLLIVMILLPLAPVFASETDTVDILSEGSTSSPVESAPVESVQEDVTEAEVLPSTLSDLEIVAQPTGAESDIVFTQTTSEDVLTDESVLTTPIDENATPNDGVDSVTQNIDDYQAEVVLDSEEVLSEIVSDTVSVGDVGTSTTDGEAQQTVFEELLTTEVLQDGLPEESAAEEIFPELDGEDSQDEASTTDEVPVLGEVTSVNEVTTDENRFTFAKGECTSMGDEMFYCAKAVSDAVVTHTDRVFAAPDAEGDKEIYIEKDGEVAAISENTVDDDAPYFDASSNTIVWHRLIDGRYQIISYDIDKEEEVQITHDRYNNMAPTRYDKLTVWQGWVGNDWEIFLLEGNDLTMVTDNTTHDITPSVNGTHIIWQSFETGAWQMKVYDMRTKSINTIEDTEGGSIQNPRFVLVYDTKFESGDVETRGYDLVSGEIVPLSAVPAPVPSEIPDPDQTGEKSALVSPQTQLRTKVEDSDEGNSSGAGTGGTGNGTPDLTDGDIVIPALVATTTEIAGEEISVPMLDIHDVVIPPTETESASTTAHIDDVIITPYTEPIEPIAS